MRTFIAVRVPETSELVRISQQLSRLLAPLKVIPTEQWHITLLFLGETSEELVPRLKSILTDIASSERVHTVNIQGLGVFPNLSRPTVIWAGFRDATAIMRIATRLGEHCETLGFTRESRPFQPHLTLARPKFRPTERLTDFIGDNSELDLGAAEVSSLQLYRSDLATTGPKYTVLASALLSST